MATFGGIKKVSKEIDAKVAKANLVSEESKAKKEALRKLFYYNKLRKNSK